VASEKARDCPYRVSHVTTIPRGRARGVSSRELGRSTGSLEPLILWGYCASRTGGRVSGSLAYPALPHDLGPSPARVSGVFPSRPPSVAEAAERRPSWPLPLLQSARGNAGTALRWFLLSWDWGPCCRCTSRASTPGSKLPSDRRRQVPVLVPPLWFRTTTTVCSARELRVCCTPQPAEGSPRFGRAGWRSPEGGQWPGSVPAVRFAPSEEFPSSAAGNASLRPLPSCRSVLPGGWTDRSRSPCRPRSPLMRGAYARRASLGEAGGRGSEELRRRIPGTDAGAPKSLGGLVARGSEEPGRPCP